MTPEQKRIMALEHTIVDLLAAMEESRMGFGRRFAAQIREKINQDRQAYKFTQQKKPQPATPAAPVEEEAPA